VSLPGGAKVGSRDAEGEAALFGGIQRFEETGECANPVLHRGLEAVPACGAKGDSGFDLALKVHNHDRLAGDARDGETAQIIQGNGNLVNQSAHSINHTGCQMSPAAALVLNEPEDLYAPVEWTEE